MDFFPKAKYFSTNLFLLEIFLMLLNSFQTLSLSTEACNGILQQSWHGIERMKSVSACDCVWVLLRVCVTACVCDCVFVCVCEWVRDFVCVVVFESVLLCMCVWNCVCMCACMCVWNCVCMCGCMCVFKCVKMRV